MPSVVSQAIESCFKKLNLKTCWGATDKSTALFDVLELLCSLFAHDILKLEYYVACHHTMFNGHELAKGLKKFHSVVANAVSPRQDIRAQAANLTRLLGRLKCLQQKPVSLPSAAGGWEHLQETMGEAEGELAMKGRVMVEEALAVAVESLDLLDSIAYGGTNNERWSEGLGTSPTG